MEIGGYFYILKSDTTNRYYIGSCICIEKRIKEHNRGHTTSTRNRGPWKVMYTEVFSTLKESRARERQVKKWKSRVAIEKLIYAKINGMIKK